LALGQLNAAVKIQARRSIPRHDPAVSGLLSGKSEPLAFMPFFPIPSAIEALTENDGTDWLEFQELEEFKNPSLLGRMARCLL
jgi:hypothetical protein